MKGDGCAALLFNRRCIEDRNPKRKQGEVFSAGRIEKISRMEGGNKRATQCAPKGRSRWPGRNERAADFAQRHAQYIQLTRPHHHRVSILLPHMTRMTPVKTSMMMHTAVDNENARATSISSAAHAKQPRAVRSHLNAALTATLSGVATVSWKSSPGARPWASCASQNKRR